MFEGSFKTYQQENMGLLVSLEKLIVTLLVMKFPAFYGTRRFITVFTKACKY